MVGMDSIATEKCGKLDTWTHEGLVNPDFIEDWLSDMKEMQELSNFFLNM